MADSVILRPRGIVIAYGVASFGFAAWLLLSPAGWPFFPRDTCTWGQWFFARLAIPLTGILASVRFGLDESKRLLRADATGFTLIEPAAKTWSFGWDEVSQWGLTRGGWRTTESEGGSKFHDFCPHDETLSVTLAGDRQFRLALPIFGSTRRSNELIAVLRLYAGERETPVVVLQSDPARRTKRCT